MTLLKYWIFSQSAFKLEYTSDQWNTLKQVKSNNICVGREALYGNANYFHKSKEKNGIL